MVWIRGPQGQGYISSPALALANLRNLAGVICQMVEPADQVAEAVRARQDFLERNRLDEHSYGRDRRQEPDFGRFPFCFVSFRCLGRPRTLLGTRLLAGVD